MLFRSLDRIRYLISNFTIVDKNTGKRVLAGLYFGYPLLTGDNKCLEELDAFLRSVVLSGRGRVGVALNGKLSSTQKRHLLGYKFSTGYRDKNFINFSVARMEVVQECWKHG